MYVVSNDPDLTVTRLLLEINRFVRHAFSFHTYIGNCRARFVRHMPRKTSNVRITTEMICIFQNKKKVPESGPFGTGKRKDGVFRNTTGVAEKSTESAARQDYNKITISSSSRMHHAVGGGNRRVKVVPRSSSLSTVIVPPWISMIALAVGSTSPGHMGDNCLDRPFR
ncbi:hypothetical protein AOG1_29790 [Geobacter sp. AOG1]|nr:hypothetical protein AOG1_29790 [Geobacter sp. AOG1]